MKSNNYKDHIIVLPEDDANQEIANGFNGFLLNLNLKGDLMTILPSVGGWKKVVDDFKNDLLPKMGQYKHRRALLLIDFDQRRDRLDYVKMSILNDLPDDLRPNVIKRVFVLGVWSEPEDLKRREGMSFKKIGEALASDCFNNTNKLWNHDLLRHNKTELEPMISYVKPFLFRQTI